MRADNRAQVLRRFFSGLTEFAFHTRLGVADPPLVDYLSELLVRFVRYDEMYPVRSPRGERLVQVSDMLVEAEHRAGSARQQVHRHIGDFTLFWTGVYPEVADGFRRSGKDAFLNYQEQGQAGLLDRQHDSRRTGRRPGRYSQAAERAIRALRLRPFGGPPPMGRARRRG